MKTKISIFTAIIITLSSVSAFATIEDIKVSNPTSSSATISWVTNSLHDGCVNYGEITLGDTTCDARPDDDVHYVQLSGLSPNTTYNFEVESGGMVDSNGGSYYSFTTSQVGVGIPYTIYGNVSLPDSVTTAEGTMVYAVVKSGGGNISYPLSILTDSSGYWLLNLGNLKDTLINGVFSYSTGDSIFISAQGANDGVGIDTLTVSGISPQDCGTRILYNTGPNISNIVHNPANPIETMQCEISAIIEDTLLTNWVSTADLYYYGSGPGMVSMSSIADSFYATIPGQPSRTTVLYYISAKDNLGDSTVSDTFSYYVQPDTCLTCQATIISQRVPDINGDILFDLHVNNCGSMVTFDVGSEMYPTIGDCASGTQYDFDIIRLLVSDLAPGDSFSGYYSYHVDDVSGSGLDHCALSFNIGPTVDNWYATCCDEFYFTRSWGRSTGSRSSFFEGEWLNRGDDFISLPTTTVLLQNYPNPFNASTSISFDLAQEGNVILSVYNLSGQEIETLIDRSMQAGKHIINWDASTNSSGIYFYKLTTAKNTFTKRMILLK